MRKAVYTAVALSLVMIACCESAHAATPYETYTYSYEGRMQVSPNAFTPQNKIFEFGEEMLSSPSDMLIDAGGRILIADTGNNRIVVLNEDYTVNAVIDGYTDAAGTQQTFNKPQGVFVASDGSLYVADTDNARIVVFDGDYAYSRTIEAPAAEVLSEGFKYNPRGVSVDAAGRIYVISQNTNEGVIALSKDGVFEGFIGAQRVKADMAMLIRRAFMTEEQIKRTISFVPQEYSNITIDEKGFIYVTASAFDRYTLYTTIQSRSTESTYAPIRKLNPSGTDVLRRNGLFPPAGDVNFDAYFLGEDTIEPSAMTEVCLFRDGMYTLVDSSQQKMFTYDSYGNLLFAFGGPGEAMGLYKRLAAIAYRGDTLLALDGQDGSITVLEMTEYGRALCDVIRLQENRQFDEAIAGWRDILNLNNNLDIAYLGIGKTQMENGQYAQAMENFRLIRNTAYYSKAYKLQRQKTLETWGLPLMAGIVGLVVLVMLWFSYARKYNARPVPASGKRTRRRQVMYGFHVIFHPFDGFWDLKNERRGGVASATIWLTVAVATQVLASVSAGFVVQGGTGTSLLSSVLNILLPIVLWCLANWCLTSLMDGKGTMKDIYIATCYALIPLALFSIPLTVAGHFVVSEELGLLNMFNSIAMFWTGLLIVFGSMSTHDYSLGKNLLVCALSVVGIGIILFMLMIFFSVIGQMTDFISNVVNEISFRT